MQSWLMTQMQEKFKMQISLSHKRNLFSGKFQSDNVFAAVHQTCCFVQIYKLSIPYR